VEEEMAVRDAIQHIALAHRRRYGYRRITAELRRHGLRVNHKRVARLMREDTLLAVQPRAFVATTNAQHELEVYINLASRLTLTGLNQLWVADITYIRLRTEFVYLAVLLDGFSRKVVGWALEKTLATRVPLAALHQALKTRHLPPGLVHHSDRGIQYASGAYVQVLRQQQMIPSMSRPANPYDNASCESFLKTLKREEITRLRIAIWTICGRTSPPSSRSTTMAPGSIRPSATSHLTSLSAASRPGLRLVPHACSSSGPHRNQNRETHHKASKTINPKCANAKLSQ
jgi:transposase InsO family protein